jgi:hypothetical protein
VTCNTQPCKPCKVKCVLDYLPQGDESSPRGRWGNCTPALPEVLTISLLDEQQTNDKTFFSDYLETSRSDVITAFLDAYKESTHTQRSNTINTFILTAKNMRHMSSNALEYKSLVKEGTKCISRLIVSYTHGAQHIFDKVQMRRAEIQRPPHPNASRKEGLCNSGNGKIRREPDRTGGRKRKPHEYENNANCGRPSQLTHRQQRHTCS